MNFVKVSKGKAEMYNNGGGRLRTFGSGEVVFADIHSKGEILVLTLKSGNVELHGHKGGRIRTISERNGISARFSDDDILVQTKNVKTELLKINGALMRTF
jgi:hypothetical protein